MARIKWVAQVACDYGGPVIVADVADYEKWMGSTPYPLSKRRILHYWGQFTHELPAQYGQDGGHVYREHGDLDALRSERDALIETVERQFEGAKATVNDEDGEAHVVLPDGRQMWIEFGLKSPYEEACQYEDSLWEHAFQTPSGREGKALFWDKEGSGDFFVGINETRDELVLLRTWVDEDEFEQTARDHVDAAPEQEEPYEELKLSVGEGPVVIAYSPHSWLGILGEERLGAMMQEIRDGDGTPEEGRARMQAVYRGLFDALSTDGTPLMLGTEDEDDIAAVLSLVPGTYAVSFGHYDPDESDDDEEEDDDDDEDDDSWSCVWCRLKLRR